MRLEGRLKAGFYPTPNHIVEKIAGCLIATQPDRHRILDPCCGTGEALEIIAGTLGIKEEDRFYPVHFDDDDVERALGSGGRDRAVYEREWMAFYNDDEIEARQNRWQKEDEARRKESMPANTKTGRDAPCPCGSGKKFKKCCLGKAGEG
jgi:hypothetical protein